MDYFVANTVLIVSGVLSGSDGPLYYPEKELAKNPGKWDGTPIIAPDHLYDADGNILSVSNYTGLESVHIGEVRNARYVKKRKSLAGESWLNQHSVKTLFPLLYEKIEAEEPVEVSTGVFTKSRKVVNGSYNGRKYTHETYDYVPDHLAVLLANVGACSIKDGCGLMVTINKASHDAIREQLYNIVSQRFGYDTYVMDIFDDSFVYRSKSKNYQLPYSVDSNDTVDVPSDQPLEVARIVSYKEVTVNKGEPIDNGKPGRLLITTTNADNSSVSSSQEQQRVSEMKLSDKDKKDKIAFITGNCSCWKFQGADAVLNSMPDDNLANLEATIREEPNRIAVVNAVKAQYKTTHGKDTDDNSVLSRFITEATTQKKEEPIVNTPAPAVTAPATQPASKPKTEEEYLAEMPAAFREDIEYARRERQAKRTVVVNKLSRVAEATTNDRLKELIGNKLKANVSNQELEEVLLLVGDPDKVDQPIGNNGNAPVNRHIPRPPTTNTGTNRNDDNNQDAVNMSHPAYANVVINREMSQRK